MKKILATGAASVMLAVMPVVGAFADTTLTDTLTVTVSETCQFTRTNGDATKSVTMAVNATNTSLTSTFKVICNNKTGYSASAVFTKISGTGAAIEYSCASGCTNTTVPAANSGTWTAVKGDSSSTTYITGSWNSTSSKYTGGTLMSNSGVTSSSGDSQQVTYKIGTRNNQAKGAYSGTATYTVTQNA